ncbi:MAG: lysine--tRNA ligase [Patescibacteria group bacterium]
MAGVDEIRAERLKKVEALRAAGMDPYPSESFRSHKLAEVRAQFDYFVKGGQILIVAGRIMSLRGQGGIAFADLYDGTEKFQVVIKKEDVGDVAFSLFEATIDASDFVEVTGTAFTTNRGEKSLLASKWRILTKSLRPIPDQWFGLKDEDERYRKRYLDFLLNPVSRNIVEKRAKFWSAVRRFHEDHGFLEVQTPVLEVTTGGADANPFVTHHGTLDIDVNLRISAGELWQKRLMVAGFPKVFEVGRIFRNEGMSAEHAQDYEQCEAYWAYADFFNMYTFLRECYQYVAQETFGTLKFNIHGFEVDLSGEWPTIDYTEIIKEKQGIDIWRATEQELWEKTKKLFPSNTTYSSDSTSKGRMVDLLWKQCRKEIVGPVILINEPVFTSPLAKARKDNPQLTERFHFIIAGSEVGQGYSELNDPLEQRTRFVAQQKLRDAGDMEAQMADMEFVEALEYGMPPTAGHGFSERLLSFLLDIPIRESQLFPLMRVRDEQGEGKSKETKVAVAVVQKSGMESWQVLNATAHLAAELGIREGKKLLYQDAIATADGGRIPLNMQHAIVMKESEGSDALRALLTEAQKRKVQVAAFTREMLETTNDKKVIEKTEVKNLSDVEFLGVLIFGQKSVVEDMTKDFQRYS